MISEIFVKIAAIVLLAAVAVVLILGIRTLFKGDGDKKTSNKSCELARYIQGKLPPSCSSQKEIQICNKPVDSSKFSPSDG